MKCPLCNSEMRIKNSGYVSNGNSLFRRQTFSCFNKECSNFGKDVKTVYIPLDVTEDSNAEVTSAE